MNAPTTSAYPSPKHSELDGSHAASIPGNSVSQHNSRSSLPHPIAIHQTKKAQLDPPICSNNLDHLPSSRQSNFQTEAAATHYDEFLCLSHQWAKHDAPMDPPITASSLEELSDSHIKANTSLRHDVNFERDLYLQPNVSSPGGRARQEQARKYWDAVLSEIKLLQFGARHPEMRPPTMTGKRTFIPPERSRLRHIIDSVRELLQVVTICRDEYILHFQSVLDTDLLMSQIERGTLDLVALLGWLARILNAHCAPMRDPQIESWLQHIHKFSKSTDLEQIIKSLRGMFAILELMRLDIANHRLRHLRPSFIKESQTFELMHFDSQITQGKFDTKEGRDWYKLQQVCTSWESIGNFAGHNILPRPLTVFLGGFIRHIFQLDAPDDLPNTFALDRRRIQSLRESIRDTIYIDVCTRAFHVLKESIRNACPEAALPQSLLDPWSVTNVIYSHGQIFDSPSTSDASLRLENIAAEYIRHTTTPEFTNIFFAPTRVWLQKNAQEESSTFRSCSESLFRNTIMRVFNLVRDHIDASPLELQEKFVPERGALPPHTRDMHVLTFERRIAHVALLHWRVWGPLVYNIHSSDSQKD